MNLLRREADDCPPAGIVRPTAWARLVNVPDLSNVVPFRKPSSHGAATKR